MMVWGNSLWHLIRQSDVMSIIVLGTLFLLSVVCWTIFIFGFVLNRIKERNLDTILCRFTEVKTPEDMLSLASLNTNTIGGYFLSQVLLSVKQLLEMRNGAISTEQEWEFVKDHIDQILETTIAQQERYLPVLSTSAAVSPLLGLFGTVWGLIQAFISISEKQSADITTVAPGLAQALITTLVGLIVAIPALVMYNILSHNAQTIETKLLTLADRTSFVLKKFLWAQG